MSSHTFKCLADIIGSEWNLFITWREMTQTRSWKIKLCGTRLVSIHSETEHEKQIPNTFLCSAQDPVDQPAVLSDNYSDGLDPFDLSRPSTIQLSTWVSCRCVYWAPARWALNLGPHLTIVSGTIASSSVSVYLRVSFPIILFPSPSHRAYKAVSEHVGHVTFLSHTHIRWTSHCYTCTKVCTWEHTRKTKDTHLTPRKRHTSRGSASRLGVHALRVTLCRKVQSNTQ